MSNYDLTTTLSENQIASTIDVTVVSGGGGGSSDSFKTIAVSGQSSVVADSATDTLTLVAGSNITLTTNAGTDTITIAAAGGGGGGDMVLASIQTVTGLKTFGSAGAVGKLAVAGTTSGSTIIDATAVAGSGTVTLPTTGTLATLAGAESLSNKTLVAPALGTPASGVLTNCTGTASGLTAGTVTTNANLTGPITSVGNATTIADAELAAIAGLTSAADKGIQFTGVGTAATYDLTAAGKALLDDADASAQRTTLGLGTLATQSGTFSGTSSGTNTGDQTITLTGDVTGSGTGSFAATIANDAVTYGKIQNVTATDKVLGRSTAGAGDVEEIACTAAGRALIDDADASAQRTTLGLGTLATQSGTFSGTSSGTNTGDQNLFSTIAVSGQSSVVADAASDTLTIVAGTNVTITTNAGTDEITINSTGGGSGADPTASVGLTAVNGAASTFLRSDGAPALDVAIAPTWTGNHVYSKNGALSLPTIQTTGTWITGGTATTTKPYVLIEPTGATSTAWSTNGTGLGINAATGFTGNIVDFQLNGTSRFSVTSGGNISCTNITAIGNLSLPAAGGVTFSGRVTINSGSNGVCQITNSGATGLTRLQLGLTTSSGPAFGVSGTQITQQLGDGTAGGGLTVSLPLAKVGGCLEEFFADAATPASTTETDLYSFTTIANTFANNGEKIAAEYVGSFISHASHTGQIRVYFAGTSIFASGNLAIDTAASWNASVSLVRVSSTVVRCCVKFQTLNATSAPLITYTELTGLTLSGTNILKCTGQNGGAGPTSGDITARFGSIYWYPVG